MRALDKVSQWGREWHQYGSWAPHTADTDRARVLVCMYRKLIRVFCKRSLEAEDFRGLDIGAGAGNVAAMLGQGMVASEWNEDGVALIKKVNPQLPTRLIDIREFSDLEEYDLILCRELYPFTRVNAFTDQVELVSKVIDALKPSGVFLLVGSTASYPHCADYKLIIKHFNNDQRISLITPPLLEAVMIRIYSFNYFGKYLFRILSSLGGFAAKLIKGSRWTPIYLIIFQKK